MKEITNKWLELIIVLSAPLLSVIDVFIINVAIPTIKKGVHATDAEMQLVIAGYLLGYAAFLITGGRAGDHFGRKKVFFWGMFAFTVASCLCGLSQSAFQLNVTRFFQGLSASFMVPQTIAFIQVLFTDTKERAKAFGLYGITLGTAAVIGQILGGYLSDTHWVIDGWRLIFFINLPIGIVTLWATNKYITETVKHQSTKFDYSGILILTLALFSLIYPLIQGREAGWPLWSFGLMILSVILFVFFIFNQKMKLSKNKNPLIDIRLFTIKSFNIGLAAVLFHFMLHTAYLLLSAVYLQNGLGVSALDCGLYFVVPGVLFIGSSVLASRMIITFGKRVLQVGIVILAIAFYLQMTLWKPGISPWLIIGLMGLWGFGNGLVLPSLLNVALKNVPSQYAGAAAGIYSTFQQTASALGVSIIGGVFFYFSKYNWQAAYHAGVTGLLICVALVGLMLYVLPDKKENKNQA
ncbi:drug resistance transporter, EmrB/QacA subfamily [Chryseobacterium soldanellicola]|uniref:Drug resistance transporter, EmrB/QacA subfamily n=1 Tax=Chryseobacterium soldanellicola TaxID=311333 RepID=A0A1H0XMR8_9FLAO|nr:MFS transporter [Chryseobacterium soldanellicola]SDQ04119.1 drug resistance transporter, EmrB/QacA subfamily [Chryseobacterium soldanellicola]